MAPVPKPSLRSRLERAEPLFYALFAGACTLWVACLFYSSLRLQTHYSMVWSNPDSLALSPSLLHPPWSAPLDDVFIHFDFARSAARGHPFEWVEGNGYSSGGTSMLYPFVLALGYWGGFRGLSLVVWAAVVACVCVFALLLASRRLASGLPRAASYLIPPALLGIGALNWTLFSGMEVAFLLAVWAFALIAWDDLVRDVALDSKTVFQSAALLSLSGVILVATRPEAAVIVFVLSSSAAWAAARRADLRRAGWVLIGTGLPAFFFMVGQAAVNRWLTGEATAAGALVKLELHHPFMTAGQMWNAWASHVGYQLVRLTSHHFSAIPALGVIVWVLALASLVSARTRRYGLLLWACLATWILSVALNGQVRWQNERYAMPAVAWLLLAAALGVGALVSGPFIEQNRRKLRSFAALSALVGTALFAVYQQPKFVDQMWFFGRASRNILDQHVRAGLLLREELSPRPRRVLVGDAGAIPYVSDMPAVDIIGLGGYAGLPFARATRVGLAAGVELIERMPREERPDLLAIYPSWWNVLPLWFGERIGEVPARGNVICGAVSKVLYRADWSPLDLSATPFELASRDRIAASLDFADIVSEQAHGYRQSRPAVGFVTMKLLPHPKWPHLNAWDAGRITPPGVSEEFELSGLVPGRPTRLLFRLAPENDLSFDVFIDEEHAGVVAAEAFDGWAEATLTLPRAPDRERVRVRLHGKQKGRTLYHLWAVQTE